MDFDDLSLFLEPLYNLDWKRDDYKFNREEKDMHPYSYITKKDNFIIVHNVLGIDKKDLKLSLKQEKGNCYLQIEGKTIEEFTGKVYSVSSKFSVDPSQLDLTTISSSLKNGLLYIIIPTKKEEKLKDQTISINII